MGTIRKISIKRGGKLYAFALVSSADFKKCIAQKWYATNGSTEYPISKKVGLLHIFIKGKSEKGLFWRHKNGDSFDARRRNLVQVTRTVNNRFITKVSKNNVSGCRGVSWHTKKQGWRVTIWENSKQIHLGFTTDLMEAVRLRFEAQKKYGYRKLK